MNYYPYGPVEIPLMRRRIEHRDKSSLNEFWDNFDQICNGIPDSVGCYIFSIRARKGIRPWYVGMAEKQSFRKECFTSHKLLNYNDCLSQRKGTPVLTLIPKHTKTNRFASKGSNGHRDSLQRNPELLNIKSTKLLRELVLPGLINTPKGRKNGDIKAFQKLIGTGNA